MSMMKMKIIISIYFWFKMDLRIESAFMGPMHAFHSIHGIPKVEGRDVIKNYLICVGCIYSN